MGNFLTRLLGGLPANQQPQAA
eukprot:COSAG06_NODE_47071_length_342_cov_0.633745_1_plen_21_part_10